MAQYIVQHALEKYNRRHIITSLRCDFLYECFIAELSVYIAGRGALPGTSLWRWMAPNVDTSRLPATDWLRPRAAWCLKTTAGLWSCGWGPRALLCTIHETSINDAYLITSKDSASHHHRPSDAPSAHKTAPRDSLTIDPTPHQWRQIFRPRINCLRFVPWRHLHVALMLHA